MFVARAVELAKCYPNYEWQEKVEELCAKMSLFEKYQDIKIEDIETPAEKLVFRISEEAIDTYGDYTESIRSMLTELEMREIPNEISIWKSILRNLDFRSTKEFLRNIPATQENVQTILIQRLIHQNYKQFQNSVLRMENRQNVELLKAKISFVRATYTEEQIACIIPDILGGASDFNETVSTFKAEIAKNLKEEEEKAS